MRRNLVKVSFFPLDSFISNFVKFIGRIFFLSLHKGVYWVEFRLANDTSDAHVPKVWAEVAWHLSLPWVSGSLFPALSRSLPRPFLIVGLEFGVEILRGGSLCCKLFRKLSHVLICFCMSE